MVIGNKTLAQAIQDAPIGVKTTLKLVEDEVITTQDYATIPANKIIVVDLNGHKIEQTTTANAGGSLFSNSGLLTIMDSKKGGLIKLDVQGNLSYGYLNAIVVNRGNLVIEGGNFEMHTNGTAGMACLFDNANFDRDTSMVINGGTFTISGDKNQGCIRAWNVSDAHKLEVQFNGGTFNCIDSWQVAYVQASDSVEDVKVEFNDGNFTATKNIIYSDADGAGAGTSIDGVLKVSGGNFTYDTAGVGKAFANIDSTIASEPTGYVTSGKFAPIIPIELVDPSCKLTPDGEVIELDKKYVSKENLKKIWEVEKEKLVPLAGDGLIIENEGLPVSIGVNFDESISLDSEGRLHIKKIANESIDELWKNWF